MSETNEEGEVNHNCLECKGDGVINFLFKNNDERSLRSYFLYCPNCFPSSKGNSSPKVNEEEISDEEYLRLEGEGWVDPGG